VGIKVPHPKLLGERRSSDDESFIFSRYQRTSYNVLNVKKEKNRDVVENCVFGLFITGTTPQIIIHEKDKNRMKVSSTWNEKRNTVW
jgi:hypothetical protein